MGALAAMGPDLGDLAQQINAEHDALTTAYGVALDHAHRAGDLLIEAKGGVAHGKWNDWIKANCRFSARTARVYAQIARDWLKIESKRQSIADLSMAKAIEIISPPTQPKAATSTPSKPVIIEATAREVAEKPAAQSRATATPESQPSTGRAFVSNLRREPTPEERAKDQAREDLADYVAGSIRAWMRAHPEHDADSAVELASETLALLKSDIENGGVKIT